MIFFAPSVIRFPHFEADRKFATRLRNKYSLHRMRNFGSSNNHDLLRDSLIDEDAVALAHARASFFPALAVHGPKLPLQVLAGKSIFQVCQRKRQTHRSATALTRHVGKFTMNTVQLDIPASLR